MPAHSEERSQSSPNLPENGSVSAEGSLNLLNLWACLSGFGALQVSKLKPVCRRGHGPERGGFCCLQVRHPSQDQGDGGVRTPGPGWRWGQDSRTRVMVGSGLRSACVLRYRHWKLGEDIDLIVRCEHDAVMTGAKGEVSFINVKTLNEWDSRVRVSPLSFAFRFPFSELPWKQVGSRPTHLEGNFFLVRLLSGVRAP